MPSSPPHTQQDCTWASPSSLPGVLPSREKPPWEELQGKAGKKAKDETGEASKAGKGQARAPQSPMQEDGVGQAGVSENWGRHTLPLGWTQ